jgi:hypothetical protein
MQPAIVDDHRYLNFDLWSSLMCEAYAEQSLSRGTEDKWREWADSLLAIDVFQSEAVPSPHLYDNWKNWAEALINAVNPRN